MERRQRIIKEFLLAYFILYLLVCPALHDFYDLTEMHLLSAARHFENPHPQEMLADQQSKFQAVEPNISASIFLLATKSLNGFFYQSFPFSPSIQEDLVLRC